MTLKHLISDKEDFESFDEMPRLIKPLSSYGNATSSLTVFSSDSDQLSFNYNNRIPSINTSNEISEDIHEDDSFESSYLRTFALAFHSSNKDEW